ncbi:MAG: hypothetical protein JWQ49_2802 [Edaphobacter sp.]|nr:hypothetical protein [Edaphobacter sp.]
MLSIGREAIFNADDPNSAHFFLLRGRTEILRLRPVLGILSESCGQAGAADYLEYFLTAAENLKKTPYLVLLASRSDLSVFELRPSDLWGAVLVYEYRLLGFGSSLFTAGDYNGSRAVIAPAKLRRQVSAAVCRYLMDRGAQIVLLNLEPGSPDSCQICFEGAMAGSTKCWWGTQRREVGATIALYTSFDATLARMGKHTRRNMRYYRRKAEAELGCSFVADVKGTLTMARLVELNYSSTHPVPHSILERRYQTTRSMDGFFCVGLRGPDGQWISLLGGRRHHGVTEVDWQMNRDGLAKHSVGTVIRSYLIEHEIAIGMRKLFFEGGTPHSMRHSFLSEEAMDIVVMNRTLPVFLLRNMARWLRPEKHFLLQTLMSPAVKWQLR